MSDHNFKALQVPRSRDRLPVPKAKCDLCLLSFEASSVQSSITMKRVVDIRRTWGVSQDAKRFCTPSYIYASARLCLFCSQLVNDGGTGSTIKETETDPNIPIPTASLIESSGGFPTSISLLELSEPLAKETNLVHRPHVVANQSSVADHMSAHGCLGLSASEIDARPSSSGHLKRQATLHRQETAKHLGAGGVHEGDKLLHLSAIEQSHAYLLNRESNEGAADGLVMCSRTLREPEPWWEVDLGGVYPVRCIRIVHPEQSWDDVKEMERNALINDSGNSKNNVRVGSAKSPNANTKAAKKQTSTLWIMVAPASLGGVSLPTALSRASHTLSVQHTRKGGPQPTEWTLPPNTFIGAVRIQGEGVIVLQLAKVEIIKGGGSRAERDIAVAKRRAATSGGIANGAGGQTNGNEETASTSSALDFSREKLMKRLTQYYQRKMGGGGSVTSVGSGNLNNNVNNNGNSSGSVNGANSVLTVSDGGHKNEKPKSGKGGEPSSRPRTAGGRPTSPSHHKHARTHNNIHNNNNHINDVTFLFLRTRVGYDWVESFQNSVRAAEAPFTGRELSCLEALFRAISGEREVECEPVPAYATPHKTAGLMIDVREMCGDLRRLQLQVQSKSRSATPGGVLSEIRESRTLCDMLCSNIIEELQSSLLRVEALHGEPLRIGWLPFLSVLGLCLKGDLSTATLSKAVNPALAHDRRLEFITSVNSNNIPHEELAYASDAMTAAAWEPRASTAPPLGTRGARTRLNINNDTPPASASLTSPRGTQAQIGFTNRDSKIIDTGGVDHHSQSGSAKDKERERDSYIGGSYEYVNELGNNDISMHAHGAGGANGMQHPGKRKPSKIMGGGASPHLYAPKAQERRRLQLEYRQVLEERRARIKVQELALKAPHIAPRRKYRNCALCQQQFPVDCVTTSVSRKVLTAIQARWNSRRTHNNHSLSQNSHSQSNMPTIPHTSHQTPVGPEQDNDVNLHVNSDVTLSPVTCMRTRADVMNGTTRCFVCAFCSQFCDPDLPTNMHIHEENTHSNNNTLDMHDSIIGNSAVYSRGVVPFYDGRFDNLQQQAGGQKLALLEARRCQKEGITMRDALAQLREIKEQDERTNRLKQQEKNSVSISQSLSMSTSQQQWPSESVMSSLSKRRGPRYKG